MNIQPANKGEVLKRIERYVVQLTGAGHNPGTQTSDIGGSISKKPCAIILLTFSFAVKISCLKRRFALSERLSMNFNVYMGNLGLNLFKNTGYLRFTLTCLHVDSI